MQKFVALLFCLVLAIDTTNAGCSKCKGNYTECCVRNHHGGLSCQPLRSVGQSCHANSIYQEDKTYEGMCPCIPGYMCHISTVAKPSCQYLSVDPTPPPPPYKKYA